MDRVRDAASGGSDASAATVGAVRHPTGNGDADRAGDDRGRERRHGTVAVLTQFALAKRCGGGGSIDNRRWDDGLIAVSPKRGECAAAGGVELWVLQYGGGGGVVRCRGQGGGRRQARKTDDRADGQSKN